MTKKKIKKVLIALLIALLTGMVLCVVVLNIIRVSGLRDGLKDMYFIEYTEKESIIYRYDVRRGRKSVVAKLEGFYTGCWLNRSEEYIIGAFYSSAPFHPSDAERVWLCCNLSDGTTAEMEASEAEKIYERVDEILYRLRDRVPAEVTKGAGPIYWSMDEKIGVFESDSYNKIKLYHADTGACECILEAGSHHMFDSADFLGIDASGRYVFYQDNLVLLFGDYKRYYIYDTKTGLRTPIIGGRYERWNERIKFIPEMTDSEIAAIKGSQGDTDGTEKYIDDEK